MNIAISREDFIIRISKIYDLEQKTDELDNALRALFPSDFTGISLEAITGLLLDDLKKAMHDEHDYISWWVCETEYGKRVDMCRVWKGDADDPDAPYWDIRTAGDLYDFLVAQDVESPTLSHLNLAVKAQEEGVKFALARINELIQTNTDTKNKGYETRNALLKLAYDKILNDYLSTTGITHNLDPKDGVTILCELDKEDS